MTKKDLTEDKVEEQVSEATVEGAETVACENAVNAELDEAKRAAEEFKDMAQRIQAEFDNYRRRNLDAVRAARNEGGDDVISALLPVVDNFERGLQAVEESARAGIELIYKQLISVLDKLEVKEIEALGKEFDPAYHHAIAKCEDGEQSNVVVEVYQKGYIRKNKVLRPSMVKVAQ